MPERADRLDHAVEFLKEPVDIDPNLDQRVMAEIETGRAPTKRARPFWLARGWLTRRRTLRVSPLGGLAFATGIAILMVVARSSFVPSATPESEATVATSSTVQFVIVVPGASRVSLMGDFNDWSDASTPMQRVEQNGVWSVTIPLQAGRYRYAFLVDGNQWLGDPTAPPALDDEFGRPGSVVTVGEL